MYTDYEDEYEGNIRRTDPGQTFRQNQIIKDNQIEIIPESRNEDEVEEEDNDS